MTALALSLTLELSLLCGEWTSSSDVWPLAVCAWPAATTIRLAAAPACVVRQGAAANLTVSGPPINENCFLKLFPQECEVSRTPS